MDQLSDLIEIRKYLHAHPELSEQEYETAKTVAQTVAEYQPTKVIQGIGGTGVLVVFDSNQAGPTVLFRSELDALPIEEINTFAHRSTVEQVAHKCGHDGHSTVLIGLAKTLAQNPIQKGRVVLLFQPAEENGAGAKAVLADPAFEPYQADYVFSFHNLPSYPKHQVVLKDRSFTAAVKSLIIHFDGKTAHAAEPENGSNPAYAIADILQASKALSNNQPERADFAVITPIHLEVGKIYYGISAGQGVLRLTIRTWTEAQLDLLSESLMEIVHSAAKDHQINIKTEWTQHFAANRNNPEAVKIIAKAAEQLQLSVTHRAFPFKWGEDFGLFTQAYKGAMFGIGAGKDTPALHNPDYDFPDDILPTGIQLFHQIIRIILS